jgi:hypothetical protein
LPVMTFELLRVGIASSHHGGALGDAQGPSAFHGFHGN